MPDQTPTGLPRISLPLLALLCLFLSRAFSPSASGSIDVDYYWHLMYGDWILDHSQLPQQDAWSWTMTAHAYRLTQWGGEVAMALADRLAGTLGTQLLCAGLLTLTCAASYRAARIFLPSRTAALAVAIGSNALLTSLPCRPHQWTHLGLAVLSWVIADYLTRQDKRVLWTLPAVFMLWVNLHGGYAFGLVLLGTGCALVAIDGYVRRDADRIRAVALPLALATAGSLAATLINPYGLDAWSYAIEVAKLKTTSLGIVDEWGATSIKQDVGLHFFVLQCALFAGLATRRERPTLGVLLGGLLLCAVGWSASRVAIMTAIPCVPFIAYAFSGSSLYLLMFEGEAARFDRDPPIGIAAAIVLLTGSGAAIAGYGDTAAREYEATHLPVPEVRFMQRHGLAGRILNAPETGGYLIRQLSTPVFMDTRLDLYGDDFFFAYMYARRGNTGWREFLNRYDADLLLLDNMAALRELAIQSGQYRPIEEGPRYTLLIRSTLREDIPSITLRWMPNANSMPGGAN